MSVGRRMSDAEQKALHYHCVDHARRQTRNLLAGLARAVDPASTGRAIGTPRGGLFGSAPRPGGGAPKRAFRSRSPLVCGGSFFLPLPSNYPVS